MHIIELLTLALEQGASDLHLSVGLPPMLRIDGELKRTNFPILEQAQLLQMLYTIISEQRRQQFSENLDIDFSFTIDKLARFRVNIFQQQRGIAAVLRIISMAIPSLDDLSLPAILKKCAELPHGLVLITGATGCGKSTTMAAIVDYINNHHACHILTIEDPIEFIHSSGKALINQREVQRDTKSFKQALRAALREDPDVILIGEMRDAETIRLALTAAETGHLVLATLHTATAAQSIHRIVDVFPANEKSLIRTLLAESLQAVISQTLVKKINGGRTAALEIMLCNPAIKNLIREDKIAQIYSVIQTSGELGMQTLQQHLQTLKRNNVI